MTPVVEKLGAAVAVATAVPLADLAIPGLPGSMTITGTASSPLDTYRER